jgi:hypothetical protein
VRKLPTVPDPPPLLALRSRGDAAVGVAVPRLQRDRMCAVLTLTAAGGQPVQVELTLGDVGRLAADLVQVLSFDADKTARWWYALRRGDRPGSLPGAALAAT